MEKVRGATSMIVLIWGCAKALWPAIEHTIREMVEVSSVQLLRVRRFEEFVRSIYSVDDHAPAHIDIKVNRLSMCPSELMAVSVEMNPMYRQRGRCNSTGRCPTTGVHCAANKAGVCGPFISRRMDEIKYSIRQRYIPRIANYTHDIIIHGTDNEEQVRHMKRLLASQYYLHTNLRHHHRVSDSCDRFNSSAQDWLGGWPDAKYVRFDTVATLGGGSFGTVKHVLLDGKRDAALKISATKNEEKFKLEVSRQHLAASHHIGPAIYHVGCKDGGLQTFGELMPAPWMDGEFARKHCYGKWSRNTSSSGALAPYCTELLEITSKMDSLGLEHYDFQPRHLVRTKGGELRVIDFHKAYIHAAPLTRANSCQLARYMLCALAKYALRPENSWDRLEETFPAGLGEFLRETKQAAFGGEHACVLRCLLDPYDGSIKQRVLAFLLDRGWHIHNSEGMASEWCLGAGNCSNRPQQARSGGC